MKIEKSDYLLNCSIFAKYNDYFKKRKKTPAINLRKFLLPKSIITKHSVQFSRTGNFFMLSLFTTTFAVLELGYNNRIVCEY